MDGLNKAGDQPIHLPNNQETVDGNSVEAKNREGSLTPRDRAVAKLTSDTFHKKELAKEKVNSFLSPEKIEQAKQYDLYTSEYWVLGILQENNITDPQEVQSLLFDLNVGSRAQTTLIDKIASYLKMEAENASSDVEKVNRIHVQKRFEASKGECVGLSVLWSFAHLMESRHSQEKTADMDDLAFFNKAQKILLTWDGQSPLFESDKKIIERFVSSVIFFQTPSFNFLHTDNRSSIEQLDLGFSLENTNGTRAKLKSYTEGVMTSGIIKKQLEKLIQPDTMVFLRGSNKYYERGEEKFARHQMAAFKEPDGDGYFFYDPNSESGEVYCENLDKLVEKLWSGASPNSFGGGFKGLDPVAFSLSRIGIHVFSLEGKELDISAQDNGYEVTINEFIEAMNQKDGFLARCRGHDLVQDFIRAVSLGSLVDEVSSLGESTDAQMIVYAAVKKCLLEESPELASGLMKNALAQIEALIKLNNVSESELSEINSLSLKYISLEKPAKASNAHKRRQEELSPLSQFRLNLGKLVDQQFSNKLDHNAVPEIIKDARLLKDSLSLSEIMNVIALDPSNRSLKKDLIKHIKDTNIQQTASPRERRAFDFALQIFLSDNAKGNLEAVYDLLELLGEELNLFISVNQIRELGNSSIAMFLHEKFGEYYRDPFGTDMLQHMPELILLDKAQKRI